jgi:hypothetical protein
MNASIHMGAALSDRLTPAQLSQTIHSGISHARRVGVADWMGAADALIEEAVAEGTCFSSGELSAYIRTYRPDLVFSANHDIGQHLRQRHQAGTLPHYTGDVAVTQLPRTTLGYSHSPAGINVFVYGPDERSVNTHLFEVDIPRPGGTVPADDALPPAPTQATTPVTPTRTATCAVSPPHDRAGACRSAAVCPPVGLHRPQRAAGPRHLGRRRRLCCPARWHRACHRRCRAQRDQAPAGCLALPPAVHRTRRQHLRARHQLPHHRRRRRHPHRARLIGAGGGWVECRPARDSTVVSRATVWARRVVTQPTRGLRAVLDTVVVVPLHYLVWR